MERNVALGLRILDTPLLVGSDMNIRSTIFAPEDDILCHRPAQFFAARTSIVNEDRNEIQGAVKDLPDALLSPLAELIPTGAVHERRRSEDRPRAIHRQFAPLIASTPVLAAVFRAQLRDIDRFQTLDAVRDAMIEYLAKERQMPVKRIAGYPALALLDRLSLLAKLFDR